MFDEIVKLIDGLKEIRELKENERPLINTTVHTFSDKKVLAVWSAAPSLGELSKLNGYLRSPPKLKFKSEIDQLEEMMVALKALKEKLIKEGIV